MVMGSALKRLRHNLAPKVIRVLVRVFVLIQLTIINPIVGIIAMKFAMCIVAAQFLKVSTTQTSATMPKEAIAMVLLDKYGKVLAANVIVLL
jgi:hypothetical protein